jgi:hypothetical protein
MRENRRPGVEEGVLGVEVLAPGSISSLERFSATRRIFRRPNLARSGHGDGMVDERCWS